MDIGSALSIVSGMQAQQLSQAKLEADISTLKKVQDLQASAVAQLLASIPNVNPDGVGGAIDITA